MWEDLPNQRAPSVSSWVAARGDDPVTAASLPTCREPSLRALAQERERGRKKKRMKRRERKGHFCHIQCTDSHPLYMTPSAFLSLLT